VRSQLGSRLCLNGSLEDTPAKPFFTYAIISNNDQKLHLIKIHHSRKKDVLATVVYQEGRVGGSSEPAALSILILLCNCLMPLLCVFIWRQGRYLQKAGRQACPRSKAAGSRAGRFHGSDFKKPCTMLL
jgi:hypothetical protein